MTACSRTPVLFVICSACVIADAAEAPSTHLLAAIFQAVPLQQWITVALGNAYQRLLNLNHQGLDETYRRMRYVPAMGPDAALTRCPFLFLQCWHVVREAEEQEWAQWCEEPLRLQPCLFETLDRIRSHSNMAVRGLYETGARTGGCVREVVDVYLKAKLHMACFRCSSFLSHHACERTDRHATDGLVEDGHRQNISVANYGGPVQSKQASNSEWQTCRILSCASILCVVSSTALR